MYDFYEYICSCQYFTPQAAGNKTQRDLTDITAFTLLLKINIKCFFGEASSYPDSRQVILCL
jgi:hypothetical protein